MPFTARFAARITPLAGMELPVPVASASPVPLAAARPDPAPAPLPTPVARPATAPLGTARNVRRLNRLMSTRR